MKPSRLHQGKYRRVGRNRYELTAPIARHEAAALLGTTNEAVRQIEERALARLATGLLETCELLTEVEILRAVERVMHHAKTKAAKNAWARKKRAA